MKYKIAVLDDYQNVALESADWSVLSGRADITVFQDHLEDTDAIERLLPFDIICVMRERAPLLRNDVERLPNLKLIASTGPGNSAIDVVAAADRGIVVSHTGYRSDPTIDLTWALILASARNIVAESNSLRSGGWQRTVGTELRGKTLGAYGARDQMRSTDLCKRDAPGIILERREPSRGLGGHRSWCPRTLESLTRSEGYPGSAYEVVTVQFSYSTTQMYE
jgi:hypothetical protein